MTHLIVAKNVAERFARQIENLPQFYLGSVAPDAVHNRECYISDYKKVSHLIPGDEEWGMVTANDEWRRDLLAFLNKHNNSEQRDFILGYCCHILTDIYNNLAVWTPFRIKYAVDFLKNGYNNIHHQESNKIDIELALTYEGADEIWRQLEDSAGVDLPGMVSADEIDMQRAQILNVWYKGQERPDISANKLRTLEGEMEFIRNATEYVARVFEAELRRR